MNTDIPDWLRRLVEAAEKDDSDALQQAVRRLVELIHDRAVDAGDAIPGLDALKANRRWREVVVVAEAVMARDAELPPTALRLLAQSLIELGAYTAADRILDRIRNESDVDEASRAEVHEAAGLTGRIAKQRYVEFSNRRHLQRALRAYSDALAAPKPDVVWHAPNLLALLNRADRDGIEVPTGVPTRAQLLADLRPEVDVPEDVAKIWQRAALVELHLATGDADAAAEAAGRLARAEGANPFALASLRRQLLEVWQLEQDDEVLVALGDSSLAMGSESELPLPDAGQLERILGNEGFIPFASYLRGLEVARAVCRIEGKWGSPMGTGFLLPGSLLRDDLPAWVIVTNHHVVSDEDRGALKPRAALANFTLALDSDGEPLEPIGGLELLWTSPRGQLDVSILDAGALPEALTTAPISLAAEAPTTAGEDPHVFVVGHPSGWSINYSIRGNALVDVDEERLQYRAPTMVGSSGSPVFDAEWDLLGVHHSGGDRPRLSDPEQVHPANEASRIDAVRGALASA